MSLKSFITVLVGNVVPAIVAVAMVPIIIERAGIESFSILTLIWLLIGYFSFLDLGMGLGLTHKIAIIRSTSDLRDLGSIVSSGLLFTLMTGLISAIVLSYFANLLVSSWEIKDERIIKPSLLALQIAAFAIPIVTVTSAIRGIAEGFERFKESSLIKGFFGSLFFILPAIVSSDKPDSILTMATSLILVRLLMLVAYMVRFKKVFWDCWSSDMASRSSAWELITYSAWITASNLSSQLVSISDRLIISSLLGVATMAYFSVPFDALVRVLIIPASLVTVLFPYFSARIGHERAASKYRAMLTIVSLGSILFFVPVCFFAGEILELWIDVDFSIQSAKIFSILALGFMFVAIAHIPLVKLQGGGYTKDVAFLHMMQLCIYVPFFYLTVKNFGVIGAAALWCFRSFLDLCALIILCEVKFAKHKL